MKIMIGVDDSPHSRAAVTFVSGMTWPPDSEVVVVSAVRPAMGLYAEPYSPPAHDPTAAHQALERFHQETASAAERELRASGLRTRARVLRGDPRTALVEEAQQEQADLLVMGSHGRTGLAKLLMGSVASYVVTHAPCSILVVKLEATG